MSLPIKYTDAAILVEQNKPIEIEEIEDNKMNLNKSILFTGTLQKMSRDRAKELAKKKGYKIWKNSGSIN